MVVAAVVEDPDDVDPGLVGGGHQLGHVDHPEAAGPDVLGDEGRGRDRHLAGGEVQVDPAARLEQLAQAPENPGVVGEILDDPHHGDAVEPLAGAEGEEVLVEHLGVELAVLDELAGVAELVLGQRDAGHPQAAVRAVVREAAPAAADLQHVIALLDPQRIQGEAVLLGRAHLQGLVAGVVEAGGVGPVVAVQGVELDVLRVVVLGDPGRVELEPPQEERLQAAPGLDPEVVVRQQAAEPHGPDDVAFDLEVAAHVGFGDGELVEAAQGPGPAVVADMQLEGRVAVSDLLRGAVQTQGERTRKMAVAGKQLVETVHACSPPPESSRSQAQGVRPGSRASLTANERIR